MHVMKVTAESGLCVLLKVQLWLGDTVPSAFGDSTPHGKEWCCGQSCRRAKGGFDDCEAECYFHTFYSRAHTNVPDKTPALVTCLIPGRLSGLHCTWLEMVQTQRGLNYCTIFATPPDSTAIATTTGSWFTDSFLAILQRDSIVLRDLLPAIIKEVKHNRRDSTQGNEEEIMIPTYLSIGDLIHFCARLGCDIL